MTLPRSSPVVVSKKSTLPVGVPEPGALAVTVAVIVIDMAERAAGGRRGDRARIGVDRQRAGLVADRVVGVDGAAGGDGVGLPETGLVVVAVVVTVGCVVRLAEVSPLTNPE